MVSGGISWEQKSTKNEAKNGIQDDIHLGIDFGTILVDFGHQVGNQMPPRGPKTPQLGAQDGPRATQEAPKTAQERPKNCPRSVQEPVQRRLGATGCPRAAQEPPRTPTDLDFEQFCRRFWSIFTRFLKDFGKLFRRHAACIAGGLRPPDPPPA